MKKTEVQLNAEEKADNNKVLRWFTRLGFLGILLACLLFIYLFVYQGFFGPKILNTKVQPIHVEQKVIKQGDLLGLKIDYCKNRDVPSLFSISYIDGRLVATLVAGTRLPVGCHQARVHVPIPADLAPDSYKLGIHVSYNKGILGVEDHYFETQHFEVVK